MILSFMQTIAVVGSMLAFEQSCNFSDRSNLPRSERNILRNVNEAVPCSHWQSLWLNGSDEKGETLLSLSVGMTSYGVLMPGRSKDSLQRVKDATQLAFKAFRKMSYRDNEFRSLIKAQLTMIATFDKRAAASLSCIESNNNLVDCERIALRDGIIIKWDDFSRLINYNIYNGKNWDCS